MSRIDHKQTAARMLRNVAIDPGQRGVFVAAVAGVLEQYASDGPVVGDTLLYTNAELPCVVRVLAIAESYAMIRREGAAPFVVSLKELG